MFGYLAAAFISVASAQNHQAHECMFEPYLHLKAQLCSADKVFIGKIDAVNAYVAPSGALAGYIWSTLSLDVERNIRATPTATFTLDTPGGTLNGSETEAMPAPSPRVGLRYLMFVRIRQPGTPAAGGWHYPPVGGPQLFYFAGLDADVELPSEQLLSDEWELHCEYQGTP